MEKLYSEIRSAIIYWICMDGNSFPALTGGIKTAINNLLCNKRKSLLDKRNRDILYESIQPSIKIWFDMRSDMDKPKKSSNGNIIININSLSTDSLVDKIIPIIDIILTTYNRDKQINDIFYEK